MPTSSLKPDSPDPPETPDFWGWTRTTRVGIATFTLLLIIFLAYQAWRWPSRQDDFVVLSHGHPVELEPLIDPNTADEASLERVPNLGPKRAALIVAYRQQHAADAPVFRNEADLGHVRGMGKKFVQQLRPYLKYPDDPTEADSSEPATTQSTPDDPVQ